MTSTEETERPERFDEDWARNGRNDMERIWMSDPVMYLCERHREKARKQEPTDCKIEDLRKERYPKWENPEYFRRCIVGLAGEHDEIETEEAKVVRLTPSGLNSCRRVRGWQKDF